MAHRTQIEDAATAWAVRTGDPAFDDWEAFTGWLEADPAHALAYDRVAAAAADAAEADLPPIAAPKPAERAPSPARRWWLGGAVAASVAALAGIGAWQLQGSRYSIETAPGETRVVALADGGSIALGGGTRIVLDRDDPRVATLDAGQALFTIRHDDAAPFRLAVGGDTIVDVGTVFDVKRSAGATSVAVSEGAVVFNPDGQNVRLDPGGWLSSREGDVAYRLAEVPLDQVGAWREGRLNFRDASLAEVADDLTRGTGVPFEVAPEATARRITGSVMLAPVASDPRALGPLLGVAVRRSGDAWVLESGAR